MGGRGGGGEGSFYSPLVNFMDHFESLVAIFRKFFQ